MIIFSFGSDFDMETTNQTKINATADLIAYATSRNIEVAGYDLVVLDRGDPAAGAYGSYVGDAWVARGPDGVAKTADACAASGWDAKLRSYVQAWLDAGLTGVELDGPYGGGGCGATNHSGHEGQHDSVARQVEYGSGWTSTTPRRRRDRFAASARRRRLRRYQQRFFAWLVDQGV